LKLWNRSFLYNIKINWGLEAKFRRKEWEEEKETIILRYFLKYLIEIFLGIDEF